MARKSLSFTFVVSLAAFLYRDVWWVKSGEHSRCEDNCFVPERQGSAGCAHIASAYDRDLEYTRKDLCMLNSFRGFAENAMRPWQPPRCRSAVLYQVSRKTHPLRNSAHY